MTFDPDRYGSAKFRQNEAIDEFLSFEFLDLGILNMHKHHWA
jgi:hypothetical protein